MTKADLIEGLSNKLGMNKGEAEKAVNIVLDDIINALKQGERVNISGFGTFAVSMREARTGRKAPSVVTASVCGISASSQYRWPGTRAGSRRFPQA